MNVNDMSKVTAREGLLETCVCCISLQFFRAEIYFEFQWLLKDFSQHFFSIMNWKCKNFHRDVPEDMLSSFIILMAIK